MFGCDKKSLTFSTSLLNIAMNKGTILKSQIENIMEIYIFEFHLLYQFLNFIK